MSLPSSGALFQFSSALWSAGLKGAHQLVCVSVALGPLLGCPMAPFAPRWPHSSWLGLFLFHFLVLQNICRSLLARWSPSLSGLLAQRVSVLG